MPPSGGGWGCHPVPPGLTPDVWNRYSRYNPVLKLVFSGCGRIIT